MIRRFARLVPFALLALIAAPALPAHADFISYNTTLSAGGPTFNRTLSGTPPTGLSGVGTAVYYGVQAFYVTTATTYTMETTAASLTPGTANDTFLALYGTSFNPSSPLANVLAANDDGFGVVGLSLITLNLSANVQYYLVSTTFGNGVTGSITTRIGTTAGGPTPVLGFVPVPEPTSMVLTGMGIVFAAGLAVRNRRGRSTVA